MISILIFLLSICLLQKCLSLNYKPFYSTIFKSNKCLSMGLGDLLNKAFANDPNLPPAQNPGLSKSPEPIVVEFLPSKKAIKAYAGQQLSSIAQAAGVEIKYGCKKGTCGTCSVSFNGSIVKACQTSLPNVAKGSKVTITIPKPK